MRSALFVPRQQHDAGSNGKNAAAALIARANPNHKRRR